MENQSEFTPTQEISDNQYRMILYLTTPPTSYLGGVTCGFDHQSLTYLQHADSVELALKQFLAGMTTGYDNLNSEIQAFMDVDQRIASRLITSVVRTIQEDILRHDWVDLMADYLRLYQHIFLEFGILVP
ncbi:hypothetical protein [Spirosoma fluminis]